MVVVGSELELLREVLVGIRTVGISRMDSVNPGSAQVVSPSLRIGVVRFSLVHDAEQVPIIVVRGTRIINPSIEVVSIDDTSMKSIYPISALGGD